MLAFAFSHAKCIGDLPVFVFRFVRTLPRTRASLRPHKTLINSSETAGSVSAMATAR